MVGVLNWFQRFGGSMFLSQLYGRLGCPNKPSVLLGHLCSEVIESGEPQGYIFCEMGEAVERGDGLGHVGIGRKR